MRFFSSSCFCPERGLFREKEKKASVGGCIVHHHRFFFMFKIMRWKWKYS